MITWFLIYLGIFLLISIIHQGDEQAWLRALIITAFYFCASLAVARFGWMASVMTVIIGIPITMKVMTYTLGSATLFTIATYIIQTVIAWGLLVYFKI